jgi:hypothetical protein
MTEARQEPDIAELKPGIDLTPLRMSLEQAMAEAFEDDEGGVAAELHGMGVCLMALEPLDRPARGRALRWLADRLDVEP